MKIHRWWTVQFHVREFLWTFHEYFSLMFMNYSWTKFMNYLWTMFMNYSWSIFMNYSWIMFTNIHQNSSLVNSPISCLWIFVNLSWLMNLLIDENLVTLKSIYETCLWKIFLSNSWRMYSWIWMVNSSISHSTLQFHTQDVWPNWIMPYVLLVYHYT